MTDHEKNFENDILNPFYPNGKVPEDPLPEDPEKKSLKETIADASRMLRADLRTEKSAKESFKKAIRKDRSWFLLTLRGSTPREEVAAAIGIDPEELAAYEHAEKEIPSKYMKKIAKHYNVTVEKLQNPTGRNE